MSENTPYRDDPNSEEQYEEDQNLNVGRLTANSQFKRPLQVLASLSGLISFLTFALLLTTFVLLQVWDFVTIYPQTDSVRDLGISLVVNGIVLIPTVIFQVPVLINMVVHGIMSFVILSFSAVIFNRGWPGRYMCLRWNEGDKETPGRYTESPQCLREKGIIHIMMAVGAGCAILVSALMVAMILIRAVALFKTRFWQRIKVSQIPFYNGWKNSTGFTVQFSLSILPAGTLPVVVDTQRGRDIEASSATEQERLIEA